MAVTVLTLCAPVGLSKQSPTRSEKAFMWPRCVITPVVADRVALPTFAAIMAATRTTTQNPDKARLATARPRPRCPSRLIFLSAMKAKITLRTTTLSKPSTNAAIAQPLVGPVPGGRPTTPLGAPYGSPGIPYGVFGFIACEEPAGGWSSLTHSCQPTGGGGHEGSGCHPGCGLKPSGAGGHPGGGLKRRPTPTPWRRGFWDQRRNAARSNRMKNVSTAA